jgi:hypothetical protein
MSKTRLLVWGKMKGNLSTLSPTREVLVEYVEKTHFQAMMWRYILVQ